MMLLLAQRKCEFQLLHSEGGAPVIQGDVLYAVAIDSDFLLVASRGESHFSSRK